MYQEEHSITSAVFLPKNLNLNQIIRRHQGTQIDYSTNDLPIIFKRVKIMKVKKRLRNCSRLMKTKETQLNATCDSEPYTFAIKDILGTINET